MTFGRFSPNELWLLGTCTAELISNRGDPTSYVHGYFAAAMHIADDMVANRVPVDSVAYPMLYLFRHAIELGFKVLLRGYSFELRHPKPLGKKGHSLAQLWKGLRPLLDSDVYVGRLEPERSSASVTTDDIDALVRCLDEVDPVGEAARYDTTVSGELTMARVSRINLQALLEVCRLSEDWLISRINARQEVVSDVRTRRRERGDV
jgi:hypothetical protein